ncbi:glycosyltransferase family 39 protein [Nocardioides ungokensis]|uniref:glycosyltransferase family 39 protein n=1 Tax=Nocardioides ungokensis TaxID=1643322 RepID=UPI0015DFA009|nr:glycosyltransferase family 39 protein [Nocardioides ungokensis]
MSGTVTADAAPAPAPEETERRKHWWDVWFFLSCLVPLGVYLPHGFNSALTRDLGVYTYGGQGVADGELPYEAILNRAGPLAHLIPGIGIWLGRQAGMDDLFSARLLNMFISMLCVGVAYLIGRDLYRSRLAGIVSATTLLCIEGFITYSTGGPREKTALVLFVLLAALAMIHRRWGVTGFFIALATLTWQPVFFAAAAGAAVAALLAERTGKLKALVLIAIGGIIPTAITIGVYAAAGQLKLFFDDFLIINAEYTRQTSFLDHPGTIWGYMTDAYGWSLYVFIGGLVVQLGLAIAALRGPTRRTTEGAAQIGFGVVTVVGLIWSAKAFNGFPDAFFVLPEAVIGIGGLAALLRARTNVRVVLVATLVWVVVATGLSVRFSVLNRDDSLLAQRADVRHVMALLPTDATMVTVEAPQPLVLAHKRNLTRYQLFGNGLIDYLEATWPGGAAGYAQWIEQKAPTVITVGDDGPPDWLDPALGNYARVGNSGKWAWYLNRDLGPETLTQARDVLHDRS